MRRFLGRVVPRGREDVGMDRRGRAGQREHDESAVVRG